MKITLRNENINQQVTNRLDNVAYVYDAKPSGTTGGTSSTTPVARDLNTIDGDTSFVSLTVGNDGFILQPGTYKISWSAPAYRVNQHQSALKDATAGTYIQMGSSEFSRSADGDVTESRGTQIVDITAANNYEIFHEVGIAKLTTGWGVATGGSLSITTEEVFTQVTITKLD